MSTAHVALGQYTTTHWNTGSGLWTNNANWSNGLPQAGEVASIWYELGSDYTVRYDNSINPGDTLHLVRVGQINSAGTAMLLIADGYDLSTNHLQVGLIDDDDGMVRQTSGNVEVVEMMTLGAGRDWNSYATGAYEMAAAGIRLNVASLEIADRGYATFTQHAGTASIGTLRMATEDCGEAYYNLYGGRLETGEYTDSIGWGGHAEFVHSGGTYDAGGSVLLAYGSSSTAEYTLSGTGEFKVPELVVAERGVATFRQIAGTAEVTRDLTVASAGDGTLSLSGGSFAVSGDTLLADEAGSTAHVALVGGHLTVLGDITTGEGFSSMFLNSGSLVAPGKLHVTQLKVAEDTGSGFTLYIKDGQEVAVDADEVLGGGGDGIIRQSGGSHDVSGHSLYMGMSTNTSGLYVLTDGEVTTGSALCGYVGNGTVEQYGGKFTAASLSLASHSTASAVYNLHHGDLVVNHNVFVGGRSDDDTAVVGGEAEMNVSGGVAEIFDTLHVLSAGQVTLSGDGEIRIENSKKLNVAGGSFSFDGGTLTCRRDTDVPATFLTDVFGASPDILSGRELRFEGVATLQSPLAIDGGILSAVDLVNVTHLDFRVGRFNKLKTDLWVGATGTFGAYLPIRANQQYHAEKSVNIELAAMAELDGGSLTAVNSVWVWGQGNRI